MASQIDARAQAPLAAGTAVLSDGKDEKAGYTTYTRRLAACECLQGNVDIVKKLVLTCLAALVLMASWPGYAQGRQEQGCFVGRDHTGGLAMLWLAAERYGDYYEIFGTIRSAEVGTMQLKADGWSGAGRMFRGHEYESGALYIQISDYTGSSLVLSVDGYGSFPFRRTGC